MVTSQLDAFEANNKMETFKNQFTTKLNKNLRLIIASIQEMKRWSVAHRK